MLAIIAITGLLRSLQKTVAAEVANRRGEPAEPVYFNQFYAAVLDLEEQLAETFDRMWGFVVLTDILPWGVPMEFD